MRREVPFEEILVPQVVRIEEADERRLGRLRARAASRRSGRGSCRGGSAGSAGRRARRGSAARRGGIVGRGVVDDHAVEVAEALARDRADGIADIVRQLKQVTTTEIFGTLMSLTTVLADTPCSISRLARQTSWSGPPPWKTPRLGVRTNSSAGGESLAGGTGRSSARRRATAAPSRAGTGDEPAPQQGTADGDLADRQPQQRGEQSDNEQQGGHPSRGSVQSGCSTSKRMKLRFATARTGRRSRAEVPGTPKAFAGIRDARG